MRSPLESAQRSVIGSLLIDPDACAGIIFRRSDRSHFRSTPMLQHIYEAALQLWQERRPVDPVTVLAALGDGYEPLMRECMTETVTAANVEAYLDAMLEAVKLDRYKAAALEIVNATTLKDAAAVWERMGRDVLSVSTVRCMSWTEAISNYLDRMNDAESLDYLHFGIEQLDNALNVGLGKFVVLAADSSAGKTALALQFAYHIAAAGKKVGFFSLETDSETLTDRLMSEVQVAGISLPKTKHRALSIGDYKRATAAGDKSTGISLSLLDRCSTIDEIRTWTIQKGFEVIFVDYIQLIDAPGEKRWDIVTNVSMQLHRLAQRLRVAVIALSQITPQSKGSTQLLTMDDLRESRQIKHDADVVMTLNLDPDEKYKRVLLIDKNKDGKRGARMSLEFDPEHMTFSRLERKKKGATPGQTGLHELPDGEGGELPFLP